MRAHVVATGLLLAASVAAQAVPITYTVSDDTASGVLGNTSFTAQTVVVSFSGDTADVVGSVNFFSNSVGVATVTIGGGPTFTFTDATYFFVNQGAAAAGIASSTQGGSIIDTFGNAFTTYTGTTAIGPITGGVFIRPDLTFGTTGGGFRIDSAGDSTFTAITAGVPEPASVALFGIGLFAIFGTLRKRAA